MRVRLVQIISLLVLFLYLLFPAYVFQNVNSMNHSHAKPMVDCPFMTDTTAMCPVKFLNHLKSWKDLTLLIPSLKIFSILLLFLFLLFLSFTPPKSYKENSYIKKQKFKELFILHKILFSKGILNSKAY